MVVFKQTDIESEVSLLKCLCWSLHQKASKIMKSDWNRPNALSAQAPPSGAKERLIVTKHNLDLMNVTNYS